MNIGIDNIKNVTVIKITGNIKYYDIDDLVEVIKDEIRKNLRFVFDLSEMPYINSAVIGEFTSAIKSITSSGGKIAFSGLRPFAVNVFRISGLLEVVDTFPSVKEAVSFINKN